MLATKDTLSLTPEGTMMQELPVSHKPCKLNKSNFKKTATLQPNGFKYTGLPESSQSILCHAVANACCNLNCPEHCLFIKCGGIGEQQNLSNCWTRKYDKKVLNTIPHCTLKKVLTHVGLSQTFFGWQVGLVAGRIQWAKSCKLGAGEIGVFSTH